MKNIENISESIFESIRHVDNDGEYWLARELMSVLDYTNWQNFIAVINKAKVSENTAQSNRINDFTDVSKIVKVGFFDRQIEDYRLSRYACYLIAMNGDPRKEAIALAQNYFAVKTRQQELAENFNELSENQKRLAIRNELKSHNSSLAEAAQNAGVSDYAKFQNSGYKGLYGGMTAADIHRKKGLKKSQKILDHMGSTELAANLFRATQTDEKLRRENIKGEDKANRTHYDVGRKVRETIKELGGTMPEDLPTPDKSIQQIQRADSKKRLE